MTQTELHRAISRATGEDVDLVARWGFSLVDDKEPLAEDDLESLTLDWDAVQAAQHVALFRDRNLAGAVSSHHGAEPVFAG